MKTCTQCGKRKKKIAFRKYWGRSSDGLRPLCVECQRIYERKWRRRQKEYLRKARQKRREKDKRYRWLYNDTHVANYLVSRLKKRACRKGLAFDLDQHLPKLQKRMDKRECEMTGIPLRIARGRNGPQHNSPSLDRINPRKGYVYTNIRIVCFAMNALLGNWGKRKAKKVVLAWIKKEN